MIQVTPTITIEESEITEDFIRASGPGGQNVNKVATAVQLRFNVTDSPSLPIDIKKRLASLAHGRITEQGILIIEARRYRNQAANRKEAIERLVELINKASQKPPVRRKTKPTLGSRIRRLESKEHRSRTKRLRGSISGMSDG
jgi:ribosome-associated protein